MRPRSTPAPLAVPDSTPQNRDSPVVHWMARGCLGLILVGVGIGIATTILTVYMHWTGRGSGSLASALVTALVCAIVGGAGWYAYRRLAGADAADSDAADRILELARENGEMVTPRLLASETNLSESQCAALLERLADRGLANVQGDGGAGSVYILPAAAAPSDGERRQLRSAVAETVGRESSGGSGAA